MSLLIDNIRLFTNVADDPLHTDYAVAIEDGKFVAIGPASQLRSAYHSGSVLDGQGRLLMPGWINTHMHLYSTFARGLALEASPSGFKQILEQLWWRLDKVLDKESIYYSALVPAMEAVRTGVTSIIDHHASPNAIDGSLDRVADALQKVGMPAVLCYEVSDRDGTARARAGINENERFIRNCSREESLYEGMIGLHAAFTLSDQTLDTAAATAGRLRRGCHLHLAEGPEDDARPRFGMSTTARLHKHGILTKNTLAAHAIHINTADREMLRDNEVMVVHNPQSNMNNGVGRAKVMEMLNAGICVGLGTDGMSAGLAGDIRAAYLLHKHGMSDSSVGWQESRQMVLQNNARIYERCSGRRVGQIKPGFSADCILVDYDPPTPMTGDNAWGHILFGVLDVTVHTTIINGDIVYSNGHFPHLDAREIMAGAREVAARVWSDFRK